MREPEHAETERRDQQRREQREQHFREQEIQIVRQMREDVAKVMATITRKAAG